MKADSIRKLALGGITSLLGVTMLAGCAAKQATGGGGGSNQGDKKETIEFVYWAAAGGEEEGFKQLVQNFESKYPNIHVNAQEVPPPNKGDYYTKIQTRIGANDSPDIFRVQYQKIGEFASKDALMDVSDVFAKDKDKFNPSLLTAVTYQNKIYGLPHHTDTLAVFYNKTYLDKLGIQAPDKIDKAWTWDQLLDVAKKIQDQKLAPYGIAFGWSASSAYRTLPFFFQNGASLLTDDMKKGNLETPQAIETLTFLQNMFKNNMSHGNSMKGSDDYNLLFTSGKAGLLVNGNWMIPLYEKQMKDYQWGVTFMPMKKSAASDLGGNALAIPANSKHADAAKKFLDFAGQPENMKKFVELGLFLPSRTDVQGPFNYQVKDASMMDKFIEQSRTVPAAMAKTVTMSQFSQINQVLADALEGLFTQGVSPQDTAKAVDTKINEVLNSK